jgi:hypothetical protein
MITWVFVPLDLILPDQPNRAVRTRMLRGVGGAPCEAPPYPDKQPLCNKTTNRIQTNSLREIWGHRTHLY